MKKYILTELALLILAGGILLTACNDDSEVVGGTASSSPSVNSIEPAEAAANTTLTLTGSGIGAVRTIVFESESVPASFNPNFNTDEALLFRVPTDAVPGQQNIVFTNSQGVSFSVSFKVLGLPVIQEVSNYNFGGGTSATYTITLTGKNLADVTDVVLSGTTTEATIVSASATSLVITFPSDLTISRTKLDIINSAGTTTTTQEFVNVDLAYAFFKDDYENGWENGSWGPAQISTTVFKSGTASFQAGYNKGNWSADGFANWSGGAAYDEDYKYLTFWVKGAANTYTFYLTGDKRAGGYGNSDTSIPLEFPANTWTYFKLDLETLGLWEKGSPFQQLGWYIKGPDDQDATLYFDDVMLVK